MERSFYRRDPEKVAKKLLGAELVKDDLRARIVETEAYYGGNDPASHASNGETERNRLMYGEPGNAYIYLIYGMHNMLNATCREKGEPGAVLIRAAEPLEGVERMKNLRGVEEEESLLDGPGKLCEAFGIDREQNGESLVSGEFRIETTNEDPNSRSAGRIGVSEDMEEDLRFYIPGHDTA